VEHETEIGLSLG